jgi:hypothetical protein
MLPQDIDSFAPLLEKGEGGDLPFHVEAVAVDVDEEVYGDQRLPTTTITVAHGGAHGEAAATHPSDTPQEESVVFPYVIVLATLILFHGYFPQHSEARHEERRGKSCV